MVLVAFLACDGIHQDSKRMQKANKLEFSRLVNCARYIFFDSCIYKNNHIVWKSSSFSKCMKWLAKTIKKEKHEYCDLLIGSHTKRPYASRCDPEESFSLHSGNGDTKNEIIPIREFTNRVQVSTLFLDCCCGNQIDLSGLHCLRIVCALSFVGYEGLVTKSFSKNYPDYEKIVKNALKHDKSPEWCIISKSSYR